ncbi:MAG TPA: hypothetical protein VHA10_02770 [Hypericibacter adhaerens]|jgi:hypothetical protein|uniref:Uncharacterized protein n=1 Tax=Hypericibacter adhaerens TaxID=2602016 RepID=A0A5J6MYE7_9PROT|nr:hypothetical protein [Hypericibacter adhaerens]QEX22738.1 hypothetical protein FRZ61_26700 [Hypericibacter adhaerens]HWA42104.1 hypothetical protein [Hypericibacter adhaerens]
MTGRHRRILVVLLAGLGLAALLAATGWWWLIFRQVIEYGYLTFGGAAACIVNKTDICELVMSLCGARHPFGVARYSPALFWLGLAILSASLIAGPSRSLSRR